MSASRFRRGLAYALLMVALPMGCTANGDDVRTTHGTPEVNHSTAASPSPTQAITPSQPAPSTPPAPPPKLYRMNETYSFVPTNGNTPGNVVLVTFDDGPSDAALLTSILDTLDRHRAHAIFFINGYRAQPHPELLKLISSRGHAIGNHTWDHANLQRQPPDKVTQEIADVQALVTQTVGTPPRFFRPPFGAGNRTVKRIAADHGLLYMTWSDGSLDWDASTNGRPDLVVTNVLAQLHPGANVLMHELPRTAEALDPLLTQLEQRGYGFIDPATIE